MVEDSEHLGIALHTGSGGLYNFLFDGEVDWHQVLFPERTSHNNVSVENEKQPNNAFAFGSLRCSQKSLFLLRSL